MSESTSHIQQLYTRLHSTISETLSKITDISTQTDISHAVPSLIAEIGEWLLVKQFDNSFTIKEDFTVWEFIKPVSDASTVATQLELAIDKTLKENPSFIDSQLYEFGKGLIILAQVDDYLYRDFSKSLKDTAIPKEAFSFLLKRSVSDSYVVNDKLIQDFAKELTDGFSASDDEYFSFTKGLHDTFVLQENIQQVFAKYLRDGVSFTDDVDGTASLQDDQELHVQKQFTHRATTYDVFHRQVFSQRVFADALRTTDKLTLDFVGHQTDVAQFSEQHFSALSKPLQVRASMSSHLARHTHKHVADAVNVSDFVGFSQGHHTGSGSTTSLTDTVHIYSQSYTADMSYFADDYVGVVRTA